MLALFALTLFAPLANAQQLQTVAEKTDYKATSRYADVVAFCEAIAKRDVAKLEYFGTSQEDRKLPLLIISDLPIATPEEAKQAGKLVVMAFANIHAGEVDGKEALLAFARDLTSKEKHPLLKDLVILIVPILNADGNELIDPKNRPGDNGPTDGAGTRENAQGLDLNRDFVKLDSPEVRALVKLFNTWDPALVVDCHTTNGSKHRYALTYDGPRYPSHDTEIAQWTNSTLFPEVAKKVKAATNYDIAPYGNFDKDRSRWESYPALPRFGVQYLALRGKIGVLSESYAHASFKDRVLATHAFVTACFEVAAEKRKSLTEAVAIGVKRVPVKTITEAFPDKLTIKGFEEVVKDGKRVITDTPKDYSLAFHAKIGMEATFKVPTMYLFPPTLTDVRENLQRHGIEVQELREDIDLGVQAFSVTSLEREARPYQKRTLLTVGGMWIDRELRVPAGTLVVKTAQPHGKLAAYLLEPETEDGLTKWGTLTDQLKLNTDAPVMKSYGNVPLTLGAAPGLPENRVINQPITEALLLGSGGRFTFGLQGSPVTPGAWLDADHFLQTKEGKLWKADARTGHSELFTDPELIKKSLAAVKELNDAAVTRLTKATFFRFNPDRTAFLFDIGTDLGLGFFDGRPAVRLTKSDGPREYVSFSPDGKRIAFVRNGNLYTVDVEKPEEKQLTADGGGEVLNAKADWVYEEEIFNRHGQAYWWSPDGKQIAFLRFDDAPVKRFSLLNLIAPRGQLESYPYPKVGDPNPAVALGVVAPSGGKPVFLDMSGYPAEDLLVARVGWMPDSKTVFAYLQNRTQTFLDFATWSTPDAKPKVLFKEKTRAWVEDTGPPHFLPDGSFLFASERSGWKHLYRYSADGKLIGPVTSGEWEVHDVLRLDATEVYFTAAFTSPTGVDLCRASLADAKTELLTEKGKSHRVSLSPAGPLFIDRFTDPQTPTQVAVVEIGKGSVRKLDTNPVRERDQFKFGRYERVKIPLKDGFELEAAITYPPDFDKKKKYPVWVFTYAGPHAPTIHDEWGGGRILDNTLATNGIIVFRVDPRSASGKGAQSAWACYKQLGVQELKDLEESVAWLCQNPYADSTRVGISGHSYGGFMAAYALTHSKTFSAGIASGPVTDWKLYDSIYTERYMLTPKENAEGYAKTSCVAAAKSVGGKLLIVHGMMDDNVHMQNSVQLADALQKAGKEFEMMFYPQARHGIGGAHYLKLQLEFIRRTMGVAK
jgi:dipeptidyl aminopeptidase/acylaminoacyl peptidase